MASHYCRKDTQRLYIDPDLSIKKLYELYISFLEMKAAENPEDPVYEQPVTERRYREIFVNDFNAAPYHPKKDQCVLCETWKTLDSDEKQQRTN